MGHGITRRGFITAAAGAAVAGRAGAAREKRALSDVLHGGKWYRGDGRGHPQIHASAADLAKA